jgi:hypothetical protein
MVAFFPPHPLMYLVRQDKVLLMLLLLKPPSIELPSVVFDLDFQGAENLGVISFHWPTSHPQHLC